MAANQTETGNPLRHLPPLHTVFKLRHLLVLGGFPEHVQVLVPEEMEVSTPAFPASQRLPLLP